MALIVNLIMILMFFIGFFLLRDKRFLKFVRQIWKTNEKVEKSSDSPLAQTISIPIGGPSPMSTIPYSQIYQSASGGPASNWISASGRFPYSSGGGNFGGIQPNSPRSIKDFVDGDVKKAFTEYIKSDEFIEARVKGLPMKFSVECDPMEVFFCVGIGIGQTISNMPPEFLMKEIDVKDIHKDIEIDKVVQSYFSDAEIMLNIYFKII